MKQIINNSGGLETLTAITPDAKKYYGVIVSDTRAFITQEKFDSGLFVIRVPHLLTEGNGYSCETYKGTLSGFIAGLAANHEVYEFDSFIELAKWLDEGK